jgi:hypothetical protein
VDPAEARRTPPAGYPKDTAPARATRPTPTAADVPGTWSVREKWMRIQACCGNHPRCGLCPLRQENATWSLKELAMAGLAEEAGR